MTVKNALHFVRAGSTWLGATLVLVLGSGCSYSQPIPPSCTSDEATTFLTDMLAKEAYLVGMAAYEDNIGPYNVREAGYDATERLRGCLVEWKNSKYQATMAYTIRPKYDSKSDFEFAISATDFVGAHVKTLKDGDDQGSPIGRKLISESISQGMDRLQKDLSKAPQLASDEEIAREFSGSALRPFRGRLMAVRPIAACDPLSKGHYMCPLSIYYEDVFGDKIIELKGRFLFLNNPWRVSEEFAEEFDMALKKGVAMSKSFVVKEISKEVSDAAASSGN